MPDDDFEPLWRATEAPASDLAFALAVEARIAKRRMQIDLAARFGGAALATGVVVALWPAVAAGADALVVSLDAAGPALAAAATLGLAMAWLTADPADAET